MTSGVDNTALLVMDVQDGIVERLGNQEQLERVSAAVTRARGRGVRMIFVRVAFRHGRRVLLEKVFPRQAEVVDVGAWNA